MEVKEESLNLANQQLVSLNFNAQAWAGACLVYAQNFTGAPVANRSAWHAWLNTKMKFDKSVPLPKDVPVVLWYEHWGTYNDGQGQYGSDPNNPYYGNWGHVTPYVPGDGIYTSPGSGYGAEKWQTIGQIESRFNSRYVGWSLDINGLQVSSLGDPTPRPPQNQTTIRKKDNVTLYVSTSNNKRPGQGGINGTYALAGESPGTPANWLLTQDATLATEWAKVHGNAVWLTKDSFAAFRTAYQAPVKTK